MPELMSGIMVSIIFTREIHVVEIDSRPPVFSLPIVLAMTG
jgi:hypothetical protein